MKKYFLLLTILIFSMSVIAQESEGDLLYSSEKISFELQAFLNEYPKVLDKKSLADNYPFDFFDGKLNLEIIIEKDTGIPSKFAESLVKREGVPVYSGYVKIEDINELIHTENILQINPIIFIPDIDPTPIEIKFDKVLAELSELSEEEQIVRINEIGLKYQNDLLFFKVYSTGEIDASNYLAISFTEEETEGDYFSYLGKARLSDMFGLAENDSIAYTGPVYIEPIIDEKKKVVIPDNLPKEEEEPEKEPVVTPEIIENQEGPSLVESMIPVVFGIIGIILVFAFFLRRYK